MKFQRKPNRWSCLVTSFAMAMDLPVEELIREIGHDGSEIISDLPEPTCRRGFHPQECIQVALKRGFSVTPIELFPRIINPAGEDIVVLYDGKEEMNWLAFRWAIGFGRGVMECRTSGGKGHAVAYDHNTILDPDFGEEPYTNASLLRRGLYSVSLWQMNRIG